MDLYIVHRWDAATPIEETMEALHDVVRAGKARYLGASSMYAWQFAKAQHTAEPKPVDAPDNLFGTLPGDPGAHGRFDDRSRASTVWTRLRLLIPKG